MSDPRRDAARRAYGAAPDKLFDRIYAVMEALRAYDAAHPQPAPRGHPLPNRGWSCGECGAPVAGRFSVCEKCGFDPEGGKVGRQPEQREEVVQHSGQPSSPTDKSAAPLVGADPPGCPYCCTPMRENDRGWHCPDPNCAKHWEITNEKSTSATGEADPPSVVECLDAATAFIEQARIAARQPRPITDAMVEAARKYLAEDTPIDMREIAIGVLEAAERARVDG